MKSTDIRDANFAALRQGLNEGRKAVYEAWIVHGAATTRELANRSGIDILTVRPRTSDLCDLGLVELVSEERGLEGIYAAVSREKWEAWQRDHVAGQQQLL